MTNEFNRNIQDVVFIDETFPLSATTGTATTSDIFDLGSTGTANEQADRTEVEIVVPALPNAVVVQGARNEIGFETSTSSTFGTTSRTIVQRATITDTAGLPAQTVRMRLPANCERYVRGTVNLNITATTGGASAATYNGRFSLRF
jgi:hypothetical protein